MDKLSPKPGEKYGEFRMRVVDASPDGMTPKLHRWIQTVWDDENRQEEPIRNGLARPRPKGLRT